MLVMGKTVNEVSTGADVFGEGETGASRLYKLGEGKFLSEKFPFPQFFIPVQRGWGLLFHRRLGLFDLLLDECREIGGFLALEPGDPEGGVLVLVHERLIKAHGALRSHGIAQLGVVGFEDPFGVLKRRLIDFFDLEHVFLHWWTCAPV